MKLKLPASILTILKKRGGIVDKSQRANKKDLIKICAGHGYKPHASVIAFETAFGGLLIPDGNKIKKGEPCWILGTHACLASGAHSTSRKRGKLVPVAYSPNDIIYYLDEKGRGYAEDTIEDTSSFLYSDNGTALVCRIILEDALFSRAETSFDFAGLKGDELSKKLSLSLIKEASGKDRRFFADKTGSMIVAENVRDKQTRFAGITKKQLDLVKPAAPAVSKLFPEMTPFIGKESIRMAFEQRTSLPEFFEHLPDLRELDISGNKLTSLPESLWRVTQLTKLDISFNPISKLPDGVGNMSELRSLILRKCPIETLPESLAGAKNLTRLTITECEKLNVDDALRVIATLPKLKELSLPLSYTLTSLAPLAKLPLKYLKLDGMYVKKPERLPEGLGQLRKLTDLRIEYADQIALLPRAAEDIAVLRLIFSRRFTDEDIKKSVSQQPSVLYLKAFAETL